MADVDLGPEDFVTRVELASFERRIDQRFDDVSKLLRSYGSKLDAISTRGTDWKTIFSGLGVFLAMLSGLFGIIQFGILDKIGGIEKRVDINRSILDGTSTQVSMHGQQIAANVRELDKQDANLQREMRILDEVLQREMRLILDAPLVRIEHLAERLRALETKP